MQDMGPQHLENVTRAIAEEYGAKLEVREDIIAIAHLSFDTWLLPNVHVVCFYSHLHTPTCNALILFILQVISGDALLTENYPQVRTVSPCELPSQRGFITCSPLRMNIVMTDPCCRACSCAWPRASLTGSAMGRIRRSQGTALLSHICITPALTKQLHSQLCRSLK